MIAEAIARRRRPVEFVVSMVIPSPLPASRSRRRFDRRGSRYSSRDSPVLIRYSPAGRAIDGVCQGPHTEHMTVRVLGPLDTGAEQLSPRERAILAALIVRLGSSVSPAELAEAYWGEDLPATWAQQIKTSIARIRRRLGHDAIATRGS